MLWLQTEQFFVSLNLIIHLFWRANDLWGAPWVKKDVHYFIYTKPRVTRVLQRNTVNA